MPLSKIKKPVSPVALVRPQPQTQPVQIPGQQRAAYQVQQKPQQATQQPVANGLATVARQAPVTANAQPNTQGIRAGRNIFQKAGDWFEDNVTQPVVNTAKDIGQTAVNLVKDPVGETSKGLSRFGNFFEENITQPVVKLAKDPIGQSIEGAESISNFVEDKITKPIADATKPYIKMPSGFTLDAAGNWIGQKLGPLSEKVKDVGEGFDEKVIQPFVQGVKDPLGQLDKNTGQIVSEGKEFLDENIGKPVTDLVDKTKEGLGIGPASDSPELKLDAEKAAAMAQYGKIVTDQAGQFDPKAYGPDTFQTRELTPQITGNVQNLPGIYSPGNVPTVPGQVAAPQVQGVSGQNLNLNAAPTVPGQVATPQLQNISGQNPNLQDINNTANVSGQESALAQELARLSNPTQQTAGYSPEMREKYIANATSGLQKQKEEAAARLKEEQMSAGNYGSSVGQKNMADMLAEYDRQMMQASTDADLMQMEAEREDRYKNIGVDQARTGLLTNVAGAGANMNLASTGFNRDTATMQNQVEQIKADYARQGTQIDNETAMAMAQFGANQGQQQFGNQMSATDMQNSAEKFKADYARQGIQIDNETAMALAQFSSGQNQQQFGNQVTAANMQNQQGLTAYNSEWDRYGAQTAEKNRADDIVNTAKQFNVNQGDTADVRNYGVYQDAARNLAGYASDTIDPQSELDYKQWEKDQASKKEKMDMLTKIFGMFV